MIIDLQLYRAQRLFTDARALLARSRRLLNEFRALAASRGLR